MDSRTGVEVLKLLRKQCDGNNGANTVIIVTHNVLIADIADTVIKDEFIEKYNPKYHLMENKEAGIKRPTYFCFRDKTDKMVIGKF